MVGVPGKSKGCVTCRRRKIRCDEGRPTCGNCQKSRRTCEGYFRTQKFVTHHGARAIDHARKTPDLIDTSENSRQVTPLFRTSQSPEHDTIVRQPLKRADAFDFEYFRRLMNSVGPLEPENSWEVQRWLPETLRVSREGHTTRLALRALCVSRLGREKGSQTLCDLGHATYGKALYSLQKDLYSSKDSSSIETITACRVMGIYELFDSPGNSIEAWSAHVRGFASVISRCDPNKFRPLLDQGALLGCRRSWVVFSVVGRVEMEMSHLEWQPAEDCPRYMVEMLSHHGMRLGACLQSLDHAIDAANFAAVPSIADAKEAIGNMLTLEEDLMRWYRDYADSFGPESPLYWADAVFADKSLSDTAGYSFRSNDVGHQLQLYWILRVVLSLNLIDVCEKLDSIRNWQQYDLNGFSLDEAFPEWYKNWLRKKHTAEERVELANHICRGAVYTTQGNLGLETMDINLFPISLALAELSQHDRDKTEYKRGVKCYARIMEHLQAARDWTEGREYLIGDNRVETAIASHANIQMVGDQIKAWNTARVVPRWQLQYRSKQSVSAMLHGDAPFDQLCMRIPTSTMTSSDVWMPPPCSC